MAGVVIGGATLTLLTTSDIDINKVVYFGSTVNYSGGLSIIAVSTSTAFVPKLDFSNATDSMYIGTVIHF